MGRQITIEVCLDSLKSTRTVQKVSAEFDGRVKWRIELCSNLIHGGGLTPSIGLVRSIRKLLPDTQIMVMIRPRLGNFIYNEDEVTTMMEDIKAFKEEGVTGFVFGCLSSGLEVDYLMVERLCLTAQDSPVTFHRAFDMVTSPTEALEAFCTEGRMNNVTRILTSGQRSTAIRGTSMIGLLTEYSLGKAGPKILPGSGINAANLPDFLDNVTTVNEIHLTASDAVPDDLPEPGTRHGLVEKYGFGQAKTWQMNEEKLRAVFAVVDRYGQGISYTPATWEQDISGPD